MAGAGLLAATGAIHLDLYLTGYRSSPVIGWLFLLQVITAFGLAAAVLATGSRLLAAAGAGFALATLGGYLLSVWVEHQLQEQRGADRPGELDHPIGHHPSGGEHPACGEGEGHGRVDVQSRQRAPGVDHGHHDRAGRDHRRGPADRVAARVRV